MKRLLLLSFCLLLAKFSFSEATLTPNSTQITTLKEGVLTVGVTGICKDDSPHHNCWVYKVFATFAEKHNVLLNLKEVAFNNSWKLADMDEVDVVATGITPLAERNLGNASYSDTYSIVKRGIRIKRENITVYKTISDFKGQSIAAVKGMTSEKDIRKRAVQGIQIITPSTWDEVYTLFNNNTIAGIAEGFYVFPGDGEDINADELTVIVDVHDLEEGKIEGNRFVVRDASSNLLNQLNEQIKNLGLPNHRP